MDNRSGVTFEAELCIPWDAPRVVVDETSTMAFRSIPRPHRVILLGRDEDVNDRWILPDGDSRMVRFRRPELHSANRASGDVAIRVRGEAREPPTSELPKYISPVKPMLGTAVQSPGYTVPEEATVGASWAPDCTPELPAPAVRMGSQPRLTTWPRLCTHQLMIAPPVVGAVLTEDIDTAAGALLHDPDMKNSTRMMEWSRLFSETPQYWLEKMGREKTLAAALRLQCDGSRLQTNIQDMELFLKSLHEAASEVLRECLADQTWSSL